MKRTRHTPEQIVRKLREAEVLREQGKSVAELARDLGINEQTYYRWRRQYGGMEKAELARLKALEKENTQLKRLVADGCQDSCRVDGSCDLGQKLVDRVHRSGV